MANSINGRVFDERTRRPVPGLTVEALAERGAESLGIVQTNADGVFAFAVDPRRFEALVTNGETPYDDEAFVKLDGDVEDELTALLAAIGDRASDT